jgi:hypothetical protein
MTNKPTPMSTADHEAIKHWLHQQHPDLADGQCGRCQREVRQWGLRLLPFPEPNVAPLLVIGCPLCGHVLLFDSLTAGVRDAIGLHHAADRDSADPDLA